MISSNKALESNWGISGTVSLFVASAAAAAALVLGLYALFGLVVVSTVFDIFSMNNICF
jgi:hypothetical protein